MDEKDGTMKHLDEHGVAILISLAKSDTSNKYKSDCKLTNERLCDLLPLGLILED